MDLSIDSDIQNNALKRREIKFTVTQYSATVSKAEMLTELCKKLNASPDSSIIVNIGQSFGERRSTGLMHVYPSVEAMEKTEPKHILKRSGKLREEKPKEQPAQDAGDAGKEQKEAKPKKPDAEKKEQGPVGKEEEQKK